MNSFPQKHRRVSLRTKLFILNLFIMSMVGISTFVGVQYMFKPVNSAEQSTASGVFGKGISTQEALLFQQPRAIRTSMEVLPQQQSTRWIPVQSSLPTVYVFDNSGVTFGAMFSIGLLIIICGLFIADKLLKTLVQEVDAVSLSMSKVCTGNLNLIHKTFDSSLLETQNLRQSFNQMYDFVHHLQIKSRKHEELNKNLQRRLDKTTDVNDHESEYLHQSLEVIMSQLRKMIEGDLTGKFDARSNDEVSMLYKGLNTTTENFRDKVKLIGRAVDMIASKLKSITSEAQVLNHEAQKQSVQLNQLTRSATEIANISTSDRMSNVAHESSQHLSESVTQTRKAEAIVKEAEQNIRIFSSHLTRANEILSALVTHQTKMDEIVSALAHNASTNRIVRSLIDTTKKIGKNSSDASYILKVCVSSAEANAQLLGKVAGHLKRSGEYNKVVQQHIFSHERSDSEKTRLKQEIIQKRNSLLASLDSSKQAARNLGSITSELKNVTNEMQKSVSKFKTLGTSTIQTPKNHFLQERKEKQKYSWIDEEQDNIEKHVRIRTR